MQTWMCVCLCKNTGAVSPDKYCIPHSHLLFHTVKEENRTAFLSHNQLWTSLAWTHTHQFQYVYLLCALVWNKLSHLSKLQPLPLSPASLDGMNRADAVSKTLPLAYSHWRRCLELLRADCGRSFLDSFVLYVLLKNEITSVL